MSKFNIKKIAFVLSFLPSFCNNSLAKQDIKDETSINNKYDKNITKGLSKDDYINEKPEPALECFGAKGNITWGNNIKEQIPKPISKDEIFNWNERDWTPVLAHCGWHQSEIIWKDSKGNYLVPTGIEMHEM